MSYRSAKLLERHELVSYFVSAIYYILHLLALTKMELEVQQLLSCYN